MNNLIARPDIPHHDFRKSIQLGIWLIKTIAIAFILPYAVIALFFSVAALLGFSLEDVRQNTVGMATLDTDAWAGAGMMWRTLTYVCYGAVLAVRLYTCRPVQSFLDKTGERLDARTKPWFDRLDALDPGSVKTKIIIALLMVIALVALFFVAHRQPASPMGLDGKPLSITKPSNKPYGAVAITLPDGSIKSGEATISQEADGRYIVTFSKAQKD